MIIFYCHYQQKHAHVLLFGCQSLNYLEFAIIRQMSVAESPFISVGCVCLCVGWSTCCSPALWTTLSVF